jgi:phage terminase large subunit-like protein
VTVIVKVAHVRFVTVLLPNRASWLAVLESELFAFPKVAHDDQIDSLSQALAHEIAEYHGGDQKSIEGLNRLSEALAFARYFG